MKIRKEITYIYVCEVCGTEYGSEIRIEAEREAKRCEKLPVEKTMFAIGDKVKTPESVLLPGFPCEGIVVKKQLVSPIKSEDSTAWLGVSLERHFYLYDVRHLLGGISSHPAHHLKLVKKRK